MSSSPLLTAMSVLLQDTIPNAIVTRITCIQDESQLVKSLTDGAIPAAKSIQLISEVDGIIIIELSKLNCHQLFHLCTMIPTLKSHFSAAEREALVELVKVMKEVYVSLKFKEENQVENLMEQLISNCATFGLDRQILQSTVDQTVENTDNHMKAQEEFIEAFELDAVLMNEVEKLRKTTETPDEVDESFTVEMVESTIESQLECQICKRLMSDSKSLPCLHSFCAICLLKPAMTDGLIICPTCNLSTKATVTDYVSHQLVTNPPVLQLQKYHKTLKTTRSVACANCILPSIHFCFDCGDLKCEVHSLPAYHREDHRLVGRKVLVDKTELKREIYRLCPAHGQEFQQFCQTCCLSICSHHECKQKHKIHGDMRDLQATIEGCAVDIKEVRRLLEEKNQLVTAKLKLLQRNQLSVAEIQQHMKDSIEKYFEEITLGLEKLKLKYQADLDAATSECLTRDEKAVESLTQSTEKSQLLCSQTEIKIKPSEMSASPITELLSLRSKLSHQLRDSSTGALLVDPLGISYPEGRLRSLNQSIAIMTSDIKVLTVPKTWETAVTIAGLQRMSVDGQYIFVLNTGKGRLLFGGYCVRRFNLINGPNPSESISVLEHSMISLIGFTVGPNGQLAVLEQPQHNLELATWRVHRSVNLVIFSRKGGEYEALGNKILIDQLNHYDTSIIIKWKSPNLFISDSTCVCEYKPDGALLRKFNFHSLMDVTDFYYDQPYDLLYVTDKTKNCLMVFDSRQHVVKAVGEPGVLPGKFLNPTGVIRDGLGHLFIADTANRRVQVFSLDGTFLKMIPFPSSIKDIPVADGEHTHLDISDHFLYLHHSNTDTVWRLKYC